MLKGEFRHHALLFGARQSVCCGQRVHSWKRNPVDTTCKAFDTVGYYLAKLLTMKSTVQISLRLTLDQKVQIDLLMLDTNLDQPGVIRFAVNELFKARGLSRNSAPISGGAGDE